MTTYAGESSSEGWMALEEACRIAPREKITAWCRDGLVASRAGLRVSRIRHLDLGTNDSIKEENVALDPADWASIAFRDPQGLHWSGGELGFEFEKGTGLPFGVFMSLMGGTYYRIQVRRRDLDQMLATAPKRRVGRTPGSGFQQSDKPIVEKMHAGLVSGDFTSASEAALHFAKEAKGGGTESSKAKRLLERYKSEHAGRQLG